MRLEWIADCFHSLYGISLLQDCCTELEARGAGATHAQTRSEKVEQVSRDVPRTSYRIHGVDFGCAMGDQLDGNIRQKQVCV